MPHETRLAIGLISGTSADGIDAVLADTEPQRPMVIAAQTFSYPAPVRRALQPLLDEGRIESAAALGRLDARLGEVFADAVLQLMAESGRAIAEVSVIGSHGQTIGHDTAGDTPYSLQIADPNRIALRTGRPVVADFRRMDIAAGGQAAPLAPLLHEQLFRRPGADTAVVNIGGISNITRLPGDPDAPISGYDCGPGNCLLDAWYREHHAGAFDRGGAWAAAGTVQKPLLQVLLGDPWLARRPPKSTGREHFNRRWLAQRCPDIDRLDPTDVQATLLQFSARCISDAAHGGQAGELLVCGGGAHNTALLKALQALLPDTRVASTSTRGYDPDYIEALLFAWLARQRIERRPVDTRRITGAREPLLLGNLYRSR